jgi:uncharacterized lipoprotein YbaY
MPGINTSLRGKIVFEDHSSAFDDAAIHIRLEDVTRADAAAVLVTEKVLQPVSHPAGMTDGPEFEMPVHLPDRSALYSVRVHVDVHRNGQITRGDFISTQSYPVLTRGHLDSVEIKVREVQA